MIDYIFDVIYLIILYKIVKEIGATRKTGGSNWGYKPPLLARA